MAMVSLQAFIATCHKIICDFIRGRGHKVPDKHVSAHMGKLGLKKLCEALESKYKGHAPRMELVEAFGVLDVNGDGLIEQQELRQVLEQCKFGGPKLKGLKVPQLKDLLGQMGLIKSGNKPDLQRRAGCKYCHALLEPAASHWGRWAPAAGHFLSPRDFPTTSESCLACARTGLDCTDTCRRFYLIDAYTEAEQPYLGMLKAYAFRRPEHLHYVEEGPKLLARRSFADNSLPPCVAQRTAEWLLGRAVDEPGDDVWIHELTRSFAQSDYQLRALVKDIVFSERYRRVR